MKCSDKVMNLYLDGMLSKQDNDDFERHLLTCNHCAEELKNLKKLYYLFPSSEETSISPDFTEKVMSEIDGSTSSNFGLMALKAISLILLFGLQGYLLRGILLEGFMNFIDLGIKLVSFAVSSFVSFVSLGNDVIFILSKLLNIFGESLNIILYPIAFLFILAIGLQLILIRLVKSPWRFLNN